MAIVKVADRGTYNSTATGDSTVTLTNPTLITPGNYLVARIAVDNSGGSGARPGCAVTDTPGNTWTVGTGALQDPGTASSGITCYLAYCKVTVEYQAGATALFNWTTGTPRAAIVIEEWTGIRSITPLQVAEVQSNNVSSTAQPAVTISPSAANQLVYVACAVEGQAAAWGAQDTDTTNGSWVDVTKDTADTGTAATSATVYGGYKIVNASGSQTWNNTLGVTSDWAAVAVVFADELAPLIPLVRKKKLSPAVRGWSDDNEPYFMRPKPRTWPAFLYVPPPGTEVMPSGYTILEGDPPYTFKPRQFPAALWPVVTAEAAGVSRSVVATVATAAGAKATSGTGTAATATVATAAGARQTSGVIAAHVAVVVRTVGSSAQVASGQATAAITGVAQSSGSRATTGASSARVAVVATAAESRQTSGVVSARVAVVARTTGTQGAVVGGAVRAAVTVNVRTAGSRQTSGAANSPAAVVTRTAASRQTSGVIAARGAVVARTAGSRQTSGVVSARVVVVARITGTQGAVVGGSVNAAISGTARCAGKHGGTGTISAAATGTARCTGKRATTGAARAGVVVTTTCTGRRAATGASRAAGAVYARTTAGQIVEAEGGYIGGATVRANTTGATANRANTMGATASRADTTGATVLGGDFDG